MPIDEINKTLFVGGGTMGCFNSLVAGIAGYEVVVYDISQEALDQAPERWQMIAQRSIEKGIFTKEIIDAGLSRITLTTDLEKAVEDADFLSESVPEKLELKRKVHQQFDQLLPPHTIMTTNSSSLVVSEIEDVVKRGDKFAAFHFHLGSTLVDITRGPRTSSETIDILKRYARSIGQIPLLLKKEKHGHIFNSMLIGYMKEAFLLVIDGYADIEDVDRAWMIVNSSEAGPFGGLDSVGLDVAFDILSAQAEREEGRREEYNKIINFLKPYIERGDLGVKTGKGFYTYPDAAWQQPDFLTGGEQ